LKISVGAYEDGLYEIAAKYFFNFLKKYPNSRYRLQVSILLGDSLRKTGEIAKALGIYKSILHKYTIHDSATLIQIHHAIYRILLKEGKKTQAMMHLKEIVNLAFKKKIKNNTSIHAFLSLAEYYKKNNKIQEANNILDKLLLLHPASSWYDKALLLKASMLVEQKRYDDLVSLLTPVINKMKVPNSNNKMFYLYWVVSNLNLKRYCLVQGIYGKLIPLFWDTPTLPSVMTGYMFSSFKCFADEHVREKMFQKLENKFKNRPSILFQIYYQEGLLYFQEGKYGKSKIVWTQALNRFPDHPKVPEILLNLDKIHHILKDPKTWESQLMSINKEKKYPPETKEIANLLLGDLYFQQQKYATALPFYFNIINKKRYRRYCLEKIVLCYYYLGKYKEAKTNLGILLLENPQISEKCDMLFLQADLYLRANKTDDALRLLKKLVGKKETQAGTDNFWKQKAKLEIGKLYYVRKDLDKAKSYLLEVFRYVSADTMEENRIAAFYLGLIATQEKNFELADTYFQIAALSNNLKIRVEALFRRGLSEKSLNSYYESINTFRDIIKKYPNQSKWADFARFELAKIYIHLHNYKKATPLLKFLAESSKDEELKKQANASLYNIKKRMNPK
jgi:tetratricopeptide (TPR) repeat protein